MKNAYTLPHGKRLVCLLIFLWGCGGDEAIQYKCGPQKQTAPNVDYNIYIENSGSMAGYLGNNANFKKVLINFISDIPAQLKKEPQLFFISGHICPFQPPTNIPLVKSVMNLNPGTLKSLCPSNGSSLLPQVIDSCTTQMGEKVSILVSDCIFSDKGGNSSLAEAEMKIFMSNKFKAEGKISTIVIKYNSSFSGIYYAESNGGKPMKVNNINRPYYLLLFGKKENLTALLQAIDFKSYPGYEASYCLSANDPTDSVYAAMTYYNKKGNFEFAKPACRMALTGAEANKGVFQFSFNADLSRLGYQEDYLMDVNNYTVNDKFSVVSVKKDTGILHTLTLKTDHLQSHHILKIGLRYELPPWIIQTGNEDDKNPSDSLQQHQTFGFRQLMSGVSQAYKASNTTHLFTIPIPPISIRN
ncbi:hypothetical protein SIO70_00200 [Chitinophaga sancti]|uniref:hypothetical protein n=1 Tax=Chitinophaga sancti TaxID=1004 RepID=UPI002A74EC8B|nr:hypothetical protein [Chitinophaga sancti]WPQ63283.1 hypothetical protein SIO70_00200 [Chitinophaga sancti]